jgi:hypothetical protein
LFEEAVPKPRIRESEAAQARLEQGKAKTTGEGASAQRKVTEGTIPNETTGRIVNANLADYHVAVHADTPEFDIDFLNHVIRICLTSARAVLVKSESWARRLRSRTRFLTQLENECAICRSHRTS